MRFTLVLPVFVMVAVLAAQVGAVAAPVLQSTFSTSSFGGDFLLASDDGSTNILLFESQGSGAGCALRTYSQSGTLLETVTVGTGTCLPRDIKFSGGDILLSYCSHPPATVYTNSYSVVDYNPGFSVVNATASYTDGMSCSVGAVRPVSITGSTKTFYVTSWTPSSYDRKIEILPNSTIRTYNANLSINTIDEFQDGNYVIAGANLVDISDADNNVILDTASSTIVAHNGANEYLTDAGRLVINNGGSFQESTNALTFSPIFFGDRNSILGLQNSWWYAGNFEDVPPSSLNLSTEVTNWRTFPTGGNTPYESDGKIYYYNRTGKTMTVWRATGDFLISNNTAPDYTIELLGVDEDEEKFVFAVTMSDTEGGRVFRALEVTNPEDAYSVVEREVYYDFFSYEDFNYVIDLTADPLEDLIGWSLIDEIFSLNFSRISRSTNTGIFDFDVDAAAYINQSERIGGVFITTGEQVNDDMQVEISFTQDVNSFTEVDLAGFDFRQLLVATIFQFNSSIVTYSISDGPLPSNAVTHNASWNPFVDYITIVADLDFTTGQALVKVYNGANDTLLSTDNVTMLTPNPLSFSGFLIGGYQSQNGGDISIDDVRVSYTRSASNYPPYYLFGTLDPGESLVKDVREAHDGYGTYQATLFGTDETLGTDYYLNPVILTFVYNSKTPVLSEAEIAALVADLQQDADQGFVEGDIWTDTISGYLDDFGFKTAGSKFIIGLALLILVTIAMYGFGSEVVIMVDVATIIMLTFLGLWPVWVTVIIGIIAATLAATAMRKTMLGGN